MNSFASLSDIKMAYNKATVLVFPSIHEGFGFPVIEAMACGCAIVSTENCMIPEIIENGVNGFMSNDDNELSERLKSLLSDPKRAETIGRNARKTIVEKYNLERFVDNWNNLLYSTVNEYRNI